MSSEEFSVKLRVYIEDTDAGGIVYYVNYLKFMERARTEYMRAQGYGKDYIFNLDLMFVVHDVAVKYLKPAVLDDELEATVQLRELRGATMRMQQSVRRQGQLLVSGDVTIACVDRSTLKPRRIPREIIDKLRRTQLSGH
ncbi:MAG: tol-pal system-associated acyl-CoA thioesterase [Halioglobus sp.]